MVFSKIPVFQIENKRLRTRQVTKAACRQDQSRLRFSTKSTVTLWKTSRFWGRFSDRTSEPSNIMKVLPFFCSMREKSLFSGHSPDAIFFLFVNGGDEVMETLSWFVAALHQCETRRFSWRQPGTLARPEKKPGFSYPGGKGLYGVWRLSLIRRFCLKTYLYIIYIYISLKMRAQRPVSAFMSPKVDRTNPCCQQRKQNYPLMSKRKESQKCRFRSEQEMQANIIATKTGLKNLNKTFFPTSNERHRQLRDGCYSYCHQGEQRWGDPLHPDSRTPTI